MEPTALGMIVATLASMLHLRKSERQDDKAATLEDYLDSLRRHNFEQLVNLIQDNADLSRSIDTILRSNHDEVMEALERLERAVGSMLAENQTFNPIARAMSQLPDQVMKILSTLNQANASSFMRFYPEGEPPRLTCMDGNPTVFAPLEGRFLNADLEMMVQTGLILQKGEDYFEITRAGAAAGSGQST